MTGQDYIIKTLDNAGFDCGHREAQLLDMLATMLLETNKSVNLTAIRDYEGVVIRHFADSLHILKAADTTDIENIGGKKVIDVGCGAGFPSLPLKIFAPGADITCLDSTTKKLVFIDRFIEAAELKGIRTLNARAETAARESAFRERYDVAVSRAVADLEILCELCLPLVRPGGLMLAVKGGGAELEFERAADIIRELGGGAEQTFRYELEYRKEILRSCVIVIKKISQTPTKYPRKYAQIVKNSQVIHE